MPTIKDVARAAGVSVATVSHVVNETRFVSPELSSRVREAMASLGYTPDGNARSLRLGRTQTIALIVPDNSNPFFAELARCVENEGFSIGYTTILANSNEQPDRELKYVETLISKRVDGLIITPTHDDDRTVLDRLLGRSRVPVVVVERDWRLAAGDVVLYDNFRGGDVAGRHLLELGHERVAAIAGPPAALSSAERVKGLRNALAEGGVELPETAVFHGDFHFAGGRAAAAKLLDGRRRYTALFAANDLMAAGAIAELHARGMRVPDDVSVVGFDDSPVAVMVFPAMTTVRQPVTDMARTAVSLLLGRIEDKRRKAVRKVLATELVVRDSTARARTRKRKRSGGGTT